MNRNIVEAIWLLVVVLCCFGGIVLLNTFVFKESSGIAICGAAVTIITVLFWQLTSSKKEDAP